MKKIERPESTISCRWNEKAHVRSYIEDLELDINTTRGAFKGRESAWSLEGLFPINIPGQMIEYETNKNT